MILQDLTWDANISAFVMWVIVRFLISVVDIKLHPIMKGLLIAYLVLTPTAILIGWNDIAALIPITIMTTILGGGLGVIIERRN